uniref:Uncharacterized protein n=1 Tax=Anguilla anguilla TaxID=7936 RepID=A0A0E9PJ14_ANGAN
MALDREIKLLRIAWPSRSVTPGDDWPLAVLNLWPCDSEERWSL